MHIPGGRSYFIDNSKTLKIYIGGHIINITDSFWITVCYPTFRQNALGKEWQKLYFFCTTNIILWLSRAQLRVGMPLRPRPSSSISPSQMF